METRVWNKLTITYNDGSGERTVVGSWSTQGEMITVKTPYGERTTTRMSVVRCAPQPSFYCGGRMNFSSDCLLTLVFPKLPLLRSENVLPC
jgi:hypothetical protein